MTLLPISSRIGRREQGGRNLEQTDATGSARGGGTSSYPRGRDVFGARAQGDLRRHHHRPLRGARPLAARSCWLPMWPAPPSRGMPGCAQGWGYARGHRRFLRGSLRRLQTDAIDLTKSGPERNVPAFGQVLLRPVLARSKTRSRAAGGPAQAGPPGQGPLHRTVERDALRRARVRAGHASSTSCRASPPCRTPTAW